MANHIDPQQDPPERAPDPSGLRRWQWVLIVLLAAGLLVSCTLLASQAIDDYRISRIIRRNQELAYGPTENAGLPVVLTPIPTGGVVAPTPTAAVQYTPTPVPVETATPTAAPTPEPASAAPMPTKRTGDVDLLALKNTNPDTVGWLSMESVSTINFAVVQGKNAYYLKHDFDHHENAYGTPFLDEGSPLASQPDNLIVYAHNMRNGEMFGELNRVLEDGRFVDHPYVYFDTEHDSMVFIPFAVVELSINPRSSKYFQYYVPNFTGPGQFVQYVYDVEKVSLVNLPWHAEYGDQLMTLVTCGRGGENRLVVFLRKVRDSEMQQGA